MIIMLILSIVCFMIGGLKCLDDGGTSAVSTYAYLIAAVVFLVIYLINFVRNKMDK